MKKTRSMAGMSAHAARGTLVTRDLTRSKSSVLRIFIAGVLTGAGTMLFGLQSGERTHGAIRRRIRDDLKRGREATARGGAERAATLADIERRRISLEVRRQEYP